MKKPMQHLQEFADEGQRIRDRNEKENGTTGINEKLNKILEDSDSERVFNKKMQLTILIVAFLTLVATVAIPFCSGSKKQINQEEESRYSESDQLKVTNPQKVDPVE